MLPLLYALHALFVLLWIGGVAFVTMIIFPLLARMENSLEQVLTFQRIENRFAKLARIYVLLTGLTGFAILFLTGKKQILFTSRAYHIWLMLLVWVMYALILIFERRFLSLFFKDPQKFDVDKVIKRLSNFHWFILFLSLLAVFLGVYGTHL
ncbi:MAG: hypothetical protein ABWJ99_03445 [Caldimicrobium sp.]